MNILKLEKPELIFTCNSSRAIPTLEGVFLLLLLAMLFRKVGLGKKIKIVGRRKAK